MLLPGAVVTKLQSEKQASRLLLGAFLPKTVFACVVNQTFTSTDMVLEFSYDGAVGTYSDVIPGMIALIGSSAGLGDLGICRIRKALTVDTVYVGEISEIAWDDDLHVTVLDDMSGIWSKSIRITAANEILIDGDVAYSDQHEIFAPVPLLGPHMAIFAESYPYAITFPDVANSYVLEDTVASTSFLATAGSVSDGTTDNPTLTINSYPTDGYIRVALQVTSTSGKTTTGYRYVLVYDSSHLPLRYGNEGFKLIQCSGSRDVGGWSFRLAINNYDIVSNLRYGTMMVLFAKDYYAGVLGSTGVEVDREHMLAVGHVSSEGMAISADYSKATVLVQGPQYWLDKIEAFISGVQFTAEVYDGSWTSIPQLTLDKGLFHFIFYRSTLMQSHDVYLTGDDKLSGEVSSPAGTLWSQIVEMAFSQVLASPACGAFGRVRISVPFNLLPEADRPTVSLWDLEDEDIEDDYVLVYERMPRVSQMVTSGVSVNSEGTAQAFFSLGPGHIPKRFGSVEILDRLLLEDQAQLNTLTGLLLASRNNVHPSIPKTLVGNARVFDISELQFCTLPGEYTGKAIPKEISYDHDGQSGRLRVSVVFEAETVPDISVDGDIPIGDGDTSPMPAFPSLPGIPPITAPEIPATTFPGLYSPLITVDCDEFTGSGPYPVVWTNGLLQGSNASRLSSFFPVSCIVKSTTYINIFGSFLGDSPSNYAVYGMKNGSIVLTASVTQDYRTNRADFNPISPTEVDGFKIVISAGLGSIVNSGALLSLADSGIVDATDSSGVTIPTTAGKEYALNGAGGPWSPDTDDQPDWRSYAFRWLNTTWTAGGPGFGIGLDNIYGWLDDYGGHFGERIGNYGRVWLTAVGNSIGFRVASSTNFGDNGGTLGYQLYEAILYGRVIYLAPGQLYNVCAI